MTASHFRFPLPLFLLLVTTSAAAQQRSYTWPQLRDRFEATNPTLLADRLNVEETKAQEITAALRPNPNFTLSEDGTQIAPKDGVWQPFAGTLISPSLSQLFERRNKRALRLESARQATRIAESNHADLERTMLFNLRNAFVATLKSQAVLQLARDNLAYWDRVLEISNTRFRAGDISQMDLDRLQLQRVQYEADFETASVNLRTAKIQLLALLNERTPLEQFDVTGSYDFAEPLPALEEVRKLALDSRPDLRAAAQAIEKSQADHRLALANGSTDPTLAAWYTHNGSFNNPAALNTLGASISIPLRFFDRNQGEKLRTQLDITRSQRLRDAAEAAVLSDVDSGYAILQGNLALLHPYKQRYLQQATRVRDTMFFSYRQGGASLLDMLNAESEYRSVQLSYTNLVGACLTAAAQLNLAAGTEVIP